MLRVAPIVCQPGNRLQPSTDKERNPIRTPSGHERGSSLPFTPLISPPHPAHSSPAPRPPRKKGTPSQLRKIQPNCVTSACKMISQHVGFALSGPTCGHLLCKYSSQPTTGPLCAKRGTSTRAPRCIHLSEMSGQRSKVTYPQCYRQGNQHFPPGSMPGKPRERAQSLPLSWRLCWQGQQSSKHEPLTHQGSRKALGQGL